MGKRYKEFLLDIITKSYQIVLAVVIVSPIVTRSANKALLFTGISLSVLLLVWAGAISAKMEG
ncbi:MAG: hypothetical protein QME05_05175 [Candidatus Margulisbacteria bacterium]|nr:hypothetical protein [Candidatus Margulisiibacteriota bacterium]